MDSKSMTNYYFVRVNGKTGHNNPGNALFYVPDEPPAYPKTRFNYLKFCLDHEIVRIGWPDTGDLSANGANKLAHGYDLSTIKPDKRKYLEEFCRVPLGSVILVPDADKSGDLYIGVTTGSYRYHYDIPQEPYECAHRISVRWDKGRDGKPKTYEADQLAIQRNGIWRKAFQLLNGIPTGRIIIPHIEKSRSD